MRNGLWGFSGVIMGGLAALVSSFLVLGAFMLSFSESESSLIKLPTPTALIVSLATPLPPIAPSPTHTTVPSATPSPTPTSSLTPTSTETVSLSPTACPIPDGWIPYTVQHGETLNPLAARYGLSPQELADANCLTESQQVVPGLILYVPGSYEIPPPYVSPIPCTPRYDWYVYIVQPGDTLYNLALRVNSSVYELQVANCLLSPYIWVGQRLYLPHYPGPVPTIPPPWPSPIPTNTEVPPTEPAPPSPTPPDNIPSTPPIPPSASPPGP
jgi:LysM repeat protein